MSAAKTAAARKFELLFLTMAALRRLGRDANERLEAIVCDAAIAIGARTVAAPAALAGATIEALWLSWDLVVAASDQWMDAAEPIAIGSLPIALAGFGPLVRL